MSTGPRPVIIKRVKRIAGGHHGGAWKVAYADFVTAMMAFFLLMWLISSTTEEQRQGIADYFNPTVTLPSSTRGGDGPFGGSSLFSEDEFSQDAVSAPREREGEPLADEAFWEIEDELLGNSGDAAEADPLLSHIRTRVTDEGLIIEVFDIPGSPLFEGESERASRTLEQLVGLIGRVLARATNPVAITGHLGAPLASADPWALSAGRAQVVRRGLVAAGVSEPRVARVTGKADREPAAATPGDPRNRRVEITLLRRFPAAPRD